MGANGERIHGRAAKMSFGQHGAGVHKDRMLQRSVLARGWVAGVMVVAAWIGAVPGEVLGADGPVILTPAAPAVPRINGPRLLGVRPGHPILYTIPATGERPMAFAAEGLPAGVRVDGVTGQISGALEAAGSYKVTLRATNAKGAAQKAFTLVAGEQVALTPPMGWNTYYAFRLAISDAVVRRQADAMVRSGLVDHGWSYINIDEGWTNKANTTDAALKGPVRDAQGNVAPNQKFPDMKALCDYIHGKGLKAGIYSSPGPLCCGGSVGSYQHEDADARMYGAWGFDYVKYDWCFYAGVANEIRMREYGKLLPASAEEIKTLLTGKAELEANRARTAAQNEQLAQINTRLNGLYAAIDPEKKKQVDREIAAAPYRQFAEALAKSDRDMVFSLCQYGLDNVWEWGAEAGGNGWRTTRDIIDNWTTVSNIGFRQAGLEKYAGPGHWNDPDMLQVGVMVRNIASRLTPDEQYAHVSLWCLLAAPLLIGGDLTKLDAFTLNLLTNDEVIAVNQDALGKQAARVAQNGTSEVWAKAMEDGGQAVGLFNRGEVPAKVAVMWKDLGVGGGQAVRDLWRQEELGTFGERFEATVPAHGVVLVRVGRGAGN